MNIRFNRLLLAGITAAAAALSVTQAAQAVPLPPTVPRPVAAQPPGPRRRDTPDGARGVAEGAQPRGLCRPEGRRQRGRGARHREQRRMAKKRGPLARVHIA